MNTLNLTIKKKWFDMIASGEKKEEYREIKPYWASRLQEFCRISFKNFDTVVFRNGYHSDSPILKARCLNIYKGFGNPNWGAPENRRVYIIKLGKIIKQN